MDNPALTIALALAAGMIAQSLAHHIRIPGIVLLLALGVVLGPDVANVIRPDSLGSGLLMLVGFAVAVILFEGGMNLRLRRLRREGYVIRRLITLGALISAIAGLLLTKFLLGWSWRPAILFATLIPVTGPTVIQPLLRRVKVKQSVATILEAEGVLLDALAAIIAAVALEVVLTPSSASFAQGVAHILLRLGLGIFLGVCGGFLLSWLLRIRNLIPEGLENVFTLSMVFAIYEGSGTILAESGIVAVTVAGIVVGNRQSVAQRDLMEFKEHLTVMLIGMLFILLAADVRLVEITELGWMGIVVVILLMIAVRPLAVFASTHKSDLDLKQKLFVSWIGPRGIIAAALASLFAYELEHRGLGGGELRALVFLVIAITVITSGLTSGSVARWLGLRRKTENGWVILGAHELARVMGIALQSSGQEVVCIDSNPKMCRATEEDGLRVIYGNGLEESVLLRSEIDTRIGTIGFTPNDDVNTLFAHKAKRIGKLSRLIVAIEVGNDDAQQAQLDEIGGSILGARPFDVDSWAVRLRRGIASVSSWRYTAEEERAANELITESEVSNRLIGLMVKRKETLRPLDNEWQFKTGDDCIFVINEQMEADARDWLNHHGFSPSGYDIHPQM